MNVGSLFSGVGLLDYGLHLAGFRHAWFCEWQAERRDILALRWPGARVYGDIRELAEPERVDVIVGGFPCKGISSAGTRSGFDHPETALWREMLRVIRVVRPRYVIVENVADLLALERGELFGEVLGGLAESGFDAEWDCFPAAAFGAPHGRDRVFVTAVADSAWLPEGGTAEEPRSNGQRARASDHTTASYSDSTRAHADAAPSGSRSSTRERDLGAPADADEDGRSRLSGAQVGRHALHGDERHDPDGCSLRIGWGSYGPAIRRWEAILGWPVPEPLVPRVDDGNTRRVERSRLSALGDGVLVQAGWLVGERLMRYDRERVAA